MKTVSYTQTSIPQGVIARVAQRLGLRAAQPTQGQMGVNITLDPIVSTGWFGPGQPLAPLAPANAAGRRFDYPVTSNINYQPKVNEGISFAVLRGLARYYDAVRTVIEACKNDIKKLEFNIVYKDPDKKPDKACAEIQSFLETPDREHDWEQWLGAVLEDMMIIDATTVYPRMANDGTLYSLDVIDGATIKPLLDYAGRTPAPYLSDTGTIVTPPSYQQIIKGLPAIDYALSELIYYPTNVSSDRVYGYSTVEQIITTINIALRRQAFFLQYYTEGSTPDLIMSVPKEWVSSQIAEWKSGWDAMLRGNTAERRGAMFVPDGSKLIDTKQGILVDKADEWLLRQICYAFGVSAQPFVSMMNRATGETAKEQQAETGTGSRMQRVRGLMNRIIAVAFKRPDIGFRFKEEDETDPTLKSTMNMNKVKSGAMTIDEWRLMDGEDPLPDGLGEQPLIFTAQGAVLLDTIINPPEPTQATTTEDMLTGQQQPGDPNQQGNQQTAAAKLEKKKRHRM